MERQPNDLPRHSKEAASTNAISLIDDTTLLAAISVLFAMVHLMSVLNVDPCTC